MGLHVALVACLRLWGLCGAHMIDCAAALGCITRGAAAAVAAQCDHFDQVQNACTAGHNSWLVIAIVVSILHRHCLGGEKQPLL